MEIKLADAQKNRDREQLEIREQLAREMRDQLARIPVCVFFLRASRIQNNYGWSDLFRISEGAGNSNTRAGDKGTARGYRS